MKGLKSAGRRQIGRFFTNFASPVYGVEGKMRLMFVESDAFWNNIVDSR
jgi:hypothetical protein